MLFWGFGDFLMQKVIRRNGVFETLFVITAFGTILLFPFVVGKLDEVAVWDKTLLILVTSSVVLFIAAILDFLALKIGKLSVVEPIWSFEIVSASLLAYFVLDESISYFQIANIIFLTAGLMLVSLERIKGLQGKDFLEKGVILALIAALTMGGANFLFGWGARLTDTLIVNFFSGIVIATLSLIVLILKGRFSNGLFKLWQYRGVVVPMCILDNLAWIAFAQALSLSPIAIVTALSESYIIIAVLLGYFINKEKLALHQKIGLLLSLVSAIVLAFTI